MRGPNSGASVFVTEVAPATSKVFLVIPKASSESGIVRGAVEAAARQVGLSLSGPAIESPTQEPEYRRAFGDAVAFGSNAAIVSTSPENYSARRWIVELAAKNRLPTIYPSRDFAEIGGLMAYDIDIFDLYRRVAHQIDTILKGTRPADIPVYQPTKFELAVNLKTAKAIGLDVPPALVARADEVIE